MRTTLLTTAAAVAVLALSACGDGGTGPVGDDTLSRAEAIQLSQAMLAMTSGVGSEGAASRSVSAMEQSSGTFTFDFDETAPCQPSGSVDITGTMSVGWDEAAGTSALSADFSVVHDACAHRLQNGGVIKVTGDPEIQVTMDAESDENGPTSIVLSERGAFTWERGAGNSGRCSVDVVAEVEPTTGVVTVDGTFCGIDVSGVYTES